MAPDGRRRDGVLRSRRWGYAAAGWSVLFALLHLYWALGGTWGLAESAGVDLAAERPLWFVVLGLYGVALLLMAAGLLGLILARAQVTGSRGLLFPALGAGVAAVLLVRALGVEALLVANGDYGDAAISEEQRRWALLVWNPWFLLGGVAFGLAAAAGWRTRSPRPVNGGWRG